MNHVAWVAVTHPGQLLSKGHSVWTQVVGLCPNKTLFIKLLAGWVWSKAWSKGLIPVVLVKECEF